MPDRGIPDESNFLEQGRLQDNHQWDHNLQGKKKQKQSTRSSKIIMIPTRGQDHLDSDHEFPFVHSYDSKMISRRYFDHSYERLIN